MSSLEDDLKYVTPGGAGVHALLASDGATWSPEGWSGTPGTGAASVLAVHEDGSLDLQVIVSHADPRLNAKVGTFERVPHRTRAERTASPAPVTGPCWWLQR